MSDTRLISIDRLWWNRRCGMAVFQTEEKLEHYIDKLEEDIRKRGIQLPPIVSGVVKKSDKLEYGNKDFRVLQGNHRLEVARRLGMTEIRCKVVG